MPNFTPSRSRPGIADFAAAWAFLIGVWWLLVLSWLVTGVPFWKLEITIEKRP